MRNNEYSTNEYVNILSGTRHENVRNIYEAKYNYGSAAPDYIDDEPETEPYRAPKKAPKQAPKKAPKKSAKTSKSAKQKAREQKAKARERRFNEKYAPKPEDTRKLVKVSVKSSFGLLFTATLVVCVGMIYHSLRGYIDVNVEATQKAKYITTLERELSQKVADNDNYEIVINSSIDYDEIYRVATEEMGMVYVSQSQICTYNMPENEYVEQYKDID